MDYEYYESEGYSQEAIKEAKELLSKYETFEKPIIFKELSSKKYVEYFYLDPKGRTKEHMYKVFFKVDTKNAETIGLINDLISNDDLDNYVIENIEYSIRKKLDGMGEMENE